MAARLAAAVRAVGETVDAAAPVTASIGVAAPVGEMGARDVIQLADVRAYQAKRRGGDQVAVGQAVDASGESSSVPDPESQAL